jgi:hypothetical protein
MYEVTGAVYEKLRTASRKSGWADGSSYGAPPKTL